MNDSNLFENLAEMMLFSGIISLICVFTVVFGVGRIWSHSHRIRYYAKSADETLREILVILRLNQPRQTHPTVPPVPMIDPQSELELRALEVELQELDAMPGETRDQVWQDRFAWVCSEIKRLRTYRRIVEG